MASLSVTEAWNETAAFVKAEARLLFPLAFMLIALPAAVTRALVPAVEVGETPPSGTWLIAALVAIVLALIGNLAISHLALRPGTSVGEALGQAGRRGPVLAGAALLVGCGLLALGFLLSLAVSLVMMGTSAGSGQPPSSEAMMRAARILALILLPVLLYVSARVMLMPAIAAAEPGGPFALLSRSWKLSAGHVMKLIGLLLILSLVAIVLQLAVQSVLGLGLMALAGPAEPGSGGALLILLVMALLNMVLGVYFATLIARLYAQRSADSG